MASSTRDDFRALLARRLNRRSLLQSGGGLLGYCALPAAWPQTLAADASLPRVAASRDDRVVVPEGYTADVVVRWGDSLAGSVASLDPARVEDGALLEPGAAAAQARQFGFNCDGIGLLDIGRGRWLVCVNHETPLPELMFPGWADARRSRTRHAFVAAHAECVPVMQASVGVSVVELRYEDGWRYQRDSRFNRRVTAHTPMEISGPAKDHPLLAGRAVGTFANCAAGTTPWGTYLTAEENADDFFGNRENAVLEPELERAYSRFGARAQESLYRWEFTDARFDAARTPREPLKFGWIVELDPRDASRPIKKRTALGRFKHEGATTVLSRDGRAVVYMGDDEGFECFYKFVTQARFDAGRPEANRDLLDAGTLYVAKFADDGSGEWLPLVWNEHPELTPERGFASQADVVLHCREAADRIGATALDRPEGVAVNPIDGRVYLSCTQNTLRGGAAGTASPRAPEMAVDAASPRAPNPSGHILEFIEHGDDPAATTFHWDVFLLAGDPRAGEFLRALPPTSSPPLAPEVTYFGGYPNPGALSAFANPDNLGFDPDGNLWIVTDGAQPGDYNNGCFVCPTRGADRGAVRQFMSGPIGAEVCGCELTPDGRSLFLTLQHPGSGGTVEEPRSHWPDGGERAPRASLIAIRAIDGRKVGG